MQLPDEAITYQYQSLLVPASEEWTPLAELRAKHFLSPARLKDLTPRLMQCRSQVAAERELQRCRRRCSRSRPASSICRRRLLDQHRRKGDASDLGRDHQPGRPAARTGRSRRHPRHRRLRPGCHGPLRGPDSVATTTSCPPKTRLGVPRIYFEGDNVDNDACRICSICCKTPASIRTCARSAGASSSSASRAAPWKPGRALRVFRREATEYLRPALRVAHGAVRRPSPAPTASCTSCSRPRLHRRRHPDHPGQRRRPLFGVHGRRPAAGRGHGPGRARPAAGAAAMTTRFLEEPFERNPVLQYRRRQLPDDRGSRQAAARAVGLVEEAGERRAVVRSAAGGEPGQARPRADAADDGADARPARARPAAPGRAARQGHQQSGRRAPRTPPIMMRHGRPQRGRAERSTTARACRTSSTRPCAASTRPMTTSARPTADLVLPSLSEHTMGQLMQMLMLATVGRGPADGRQSLWPPGRGSVQTAHEAGAEGVDLSNSFSDASLKRR